MNKIGFIGAGNMGGSIISGIINCGGINPENVYVCDKALSDEIKSYGVNATDIAGVVSNSDFVVLAVKPNIFPDILADIKKCDGHAGKVYISIAAGITIESIKSALGNNVKVVRVMPNLALKVGEGMTVVSHSESVNGTDLDFAVSIFDCVGKTALLDEKYIDMSIAINGSGPAYVFMFIEAMADAAVKNGIDRKTAYLLSTQTVLGSAKMALETQLHPGVLKDMVCSPGGTTIEAVCSLEKDGFRDAIINAIDACTKKAISMSNNKK